MVHDVYLVQIKSPEESKGEWDLIKLFATIPGEQAFRPLNEGGCPALANN
jgi:branched-chain amino acid transport system substrate-binding protein